MAGETIITVVGNMVADPELRFTQQGLAVANFTIASTPRTFDRQTNEWKDEEALFLRASIWREAAEQVTQSLSKGMRVIATGFLKQRSYETKEGEKRTSFELEVQEIGPSLRYATAQVQKAPSNQQARGNQVPGGPQSYPGGSPQGPTGQGYGQPQQQDPWSQQGPAGPAPTGYQQGNTPQYDGPPTY
jgi:single-strand DNA-binding protein